MGLILAKVLYFWLLQIVEICQILHFSGQVVLISSEVRVEGLETLDYLDNLQNRERFTEQGDAITVELEVSLKFLKQAYVLCLFNSNLYTLFYVYRSC
ncbi:hypothetical protein ES288_A06G180800v1 [Gossypium darwinii]|nr:hypothetical protein ES288_A06G180800v1 [Gossypium darwinii]